MLRMDGRLTSIILLLRSIVSELLSHKSVTWPGADRVEEFPVSSSTPLAIFAIRSPGRSERLVGPEPQELFWQSPVRRRGSHRRPTLGCTLLFLSCAAHPFQHSLAPQLRGFFVRLGQEARDADPGNQSGDEKRDPETHQARIRHFPVVDVWCHGDESRRDHPRDEQSQFWRRRRRSISPIWSRRFMAGRSRARRSSGIGLGKCAPRQEWKAARMA